MFGCLGVQDWAGEQPRRDAKSHLEGRCYRNATRFDSPDTTACAALAKIDPRNPLPYYYRATALAGNPQSMEGQSGFGWNAPPYYSSWVSFTDAPAIISLYEQALALDRNAHKLPDRTRAYLELGYAYAARDDWQKAVKNWRTTLTLKPGLQGLEEKMGFAQDRIVARFKLWRLPPSQCERLSFWECRLVAGCDRNVGASISGGNSADSVTSSDLAYKGCAGKPQPGASPHPKPDCTVLDAAHCAMVADCLPNKGPQNYCKNRP